MRLPLLELICCPACGEALSPERVEEDAVEIREGELVCPRGHCYPIRRGLAHLHLNDDSWTVKATEAEGWVTFHKNLGFYDVVEDAVDLHIPYYPEQPWIDVAYSFDVAMKQLALTGEETILDLGAGRGWAAKAFALRGCRAAALDVAPDENVGLGRARALMDHAGVYFDRIIGDGENLPFFPESFDLVFCSATLHHSSNLPLLLQNAGRVLKPGGRLCAMHEPCISVLEDEGAILARDAAQETSVGINETRPNLLQYVAALDAAGLRLERAARAHAYGMSDADLLAATAGKGLAPPASRHDVSGLRREWSRRRRARQRGLDSPVRELLARQTDERRRLEFRILLWESGDMLLIARKPPK